MSFVRKLHHGKQIYQYIGIFAGTGETVSIAEASVLLESIVCLCLSDIFLITSHHCYPYSYIEITAAPHMLLAVAAKYKVGSVEVPSAATRWQKRPLTVITCLFIIIYFISFNCICVVTGG